MAKAKYEVWLEKDNLTRIEAWASDGLTNEQIAKNIGVSRSTLNNWMTKHLDILGALKKGREPVIRNLENSLIKKAKGFEYEETTTEIIKMDDGSTRQKVIKHKRYSPPDSSAAMFLLKNYRPDKYRNYNELTKQKIEAEIKKLEAEAEKALREAETENRFDERLNMYMEQVQDVIINGDD